MPTLELPTSVRNRSPSDKRRSPQPNRRFPSACIRDRRPQQGRPGSSKDQEVHRLPLIPSRLHPHLGDLPEEQPVRQCSRSLPKARTQGLLQPRPATRRSPPAWSARRPPPGRYRSRRPARRTAAHLPPLKKRLLMMNVRIRSWPPTGAVGKRKSGPRARSTGCLKAAPASRLSPGVRPARHLRRQRTATTILATPPPPRSPFRLASRPAHPSAAANPSPPRRISPAHFHAATASPGHRRLSHKALVGGARSRV